MPQESAARGRGVEPVEAPQRAPALFSIVRIAFTASALGLVGWALWITSWILDYGSVRLVEPNSMILLLEVFALTVLLGSGSVLVAFETWTINTKKKSR
jgi:hypothetical protein